MIKIYKDEFFKFNQFDLRKDGDIFQTILDERKDKIDSKRFFLRYLPQVVADKYDFDNLESLKTFRNDCLSNNLLKGMGGCNLHEDWIRKSKEYSEGIRYVGKKISDPSGKVLGTFNIEKGKIIYSPIFPYFYEERDNTKFANDTYFTTMTFEEIMQRQIDLSIEFYIHTGTRIHASIEELSKYGRYIYEKVSKDQMLEFVYQPEIGQKVYRKHMGF